MEYTRLPDGGMSLTQVKYAEALKPIAWKGSVAEPTQSNHSLALVSDAEPSQAGGEKALDAAGVTVLRGGIGAVLFLCLTRWDLLFDLIALQTQVTNASVQALRDCNAIITRAKRHKCQGLRFHPLPGRERRLAAVADSSHASKKSSYAFEGNLVFLQPEIWAEAQSLSEHQKTVPSGRVPGLSGKVHPLHVKSQKAKRLSQSTSHAETLSQLSVTAVAECVAMRYT